MPADDVVILRVDTPSTLDMEDMDTPHTACSVVKIVLWTVLGVWLAVGATMAILYFTHRYPCGWTVPGPTGSPCLNVHNRSVCTMARRVAETSVPVPDSCPAIGQAIDLLKWIFWGPIILLVVIGVALSPVVVCM